MTPIFAYCGCFALAALLFGAGYWYRRDEGIKLAFQKGYDQGFLACQFVAERTIENLRAKISHLTPARSKGGKFAKREGRG